MTKDVKPSKFYLVHKHDKRRRSEATTERNEERWERMSEDGMMRWQEVSSFFFLKSPGFPVGEGVPPWPLVHMVGEKIKSWEIIRLRFIHTTITWWRAWLLIWLSPNFSIRQVFKHIWEHWQYLRLQTIRMLQRAPLSCLCFLYNRFAMECAYWFHFPCW